MNGRISRFSVWATASVLAAATFAVVEPASAAGDGSSGGRSRGLMVLVRPTARTAMASARNQHHRVENRAARTPSTATYANPDGTWTFESRTGVVRSKSDANKWTAIDPRIVRRQGFYEPRAAAFEALFSGGGDRQVGSLKAGTSTGVSVGWGAVLPKPRVDGSELRYSGAVEGGDLIVNSRVTGFEFSMKLNHAPSAGVRQISYRVPLRFEGVVPRLRADGSIVLRDRNRRVGGITAPVMWDESASGDRRRVVTRLEGAGDTRTLVLEPDMTFLRDPATSYPVTIDPTVTLDVAVDTWMDSLVPASSQISSPELRIGSNNLGINKDRSFLGFDLTPLATMPPGVLSSATLQVTNFATGSCAGSAVRMSQITEAWNPSTVTWGTQPATTSAGSSTSTAAHGASACAGEGPMTFDATAVMNSWLGAHATNNFGVQLKADNEGAASGYRKLRSAENGDPTKSPKLVVNYNAYPNVPQGLTVSPGSTSYASAKTTTLTPTLATIVSDPDAGPVRGYFEIYSGTTAVWSGTSVWGASGDSVSVAVPAGVLLNGSTYTVAAYSQDATLKSQSAALKVLQVDTAAPTVAVPATRIFQTDGPPIPASAHYLDAGKYQTVQVAGTNGIPLSGVTAARLTIWAMGSPSSSGYVQVYPTPAAGHDGPNSMDVPVSPTLSSRVITVPVSESGAVDLRFTGAGTVGLAVDLTGYYIGGGLPTEPMNPKVVAGDGGAVVTWERPSSDGQSPLTSYSVTRQPGAATVAAAPEATGIELRGLANSSQYSATVSASNAEGNGPASSVTEGIVPGAMGPVVISSALYTDGSTVQEVAPLDGVTSFSWLDPNATTSTFQYSKDGATPITASSATKGLSWYPAPGAHTLRVRAVTAGGTAGPWATVSFTVIARPTVPIPDGLVGATGPNGTVTLSGIVRTTDGAGATANFYANRANGQPVAGTPYGFKMLEVSGSRAAVSLNPDDVAPGESITWWMTTCVDSGSDQSCSPETAHQTVTVPSNPVPPATTLLTVPGASMTSRVFTETPCGAGPCPVPPAGMFVGQNSGSLHASLLKFDLSGLPVASRVTSATLHLHSLAGGAAIGLAVDSMAETWDGSTSTADIDAAASDPVWEGPAVPNQDVDVDLTNLANEWTTTDSLRAGVRLRSTGDGGLSFGLPNDVLVAARPTLEIRYIPITPPTTVRNLVASAGDGGVRLSWHEPADAGSNEPLSAYKVTIKNSAGVVVAQRDTSDIATTFTGLANGSSYTAAVSPVGGGGAGPTSSISFTPVAVAAGNVIALTASYVQARASLSSGVSKTVGAATSGLSAVSSFVSALTNQVGNLLLRGGLTAQMSQGEPSGAETLPTLADTLVRSGPSGRVLVTTSVVTKKSVVDAAGSPVDVTDGQDLTFTYSQQAGAFTLVDTEDADASWAPDGDVGQGDEVDATDLPAPEPPSEASLTYRSLNVAQPTVGLVPTAQLAASAKTLTKADRDRIVTWGLGHVSDRWEYAANCTNFASNALHNGGHVPMIDHGGILPYRSSRNWFKYYRPGRLGTMVQASYTWAGSKNLRNFLFDQGNHSVGRFRDAVAGDYVFYHWKNSKGWHDHTSVVSSTNSMYPNNFFVMQSDANYSYRLINDQKASILSAAGARDLTIWIIHVSKIG